MANGLIYIGTVVEIDPDGPLVNVPQLAPSAKFGPMPSLVPDLAVDERVAVSNIGGTANALIVLGRMSSRAPTQEEIPGLDPRLDAIEAKDVAQDGRLTAVENVNTTQTTRLDAGDTKNTAQDGRLTAVEGRATTVENRATAVEGRATTLENRATAIEGVNTTQNTNITANGTAITTLRADTAGKVTTKGDLLVAPSSGVLARQPVGANGQALIADSSQANGVVYSEIRGLPVGGTGLTGATGATRYVGGTTGKPTSGTFAVGDYAIDRTSGDVWVCTAAGSPGTWISRAAVLPVGVVAHGRRTTDYGPLAATEEIRFVASNLGLAAGRKYLFSCHIAGGIYLPNGVGFGILRLRYSITGPAGLGNTLLTQSCVYCGNTAQGFTIRAETYYVPPSDQTVSIAGTTQGATTDYRVLAGATYPMEFIVEDKGPGGAPFGL